MILKTGNKAYLYISLLISLAVGVLTWNLTDLQINTPPKLIQLKNEEKKLNSPVYFVNNTIREQWLTLNAKDRAKEQAKYISKEREIYFENIKHLFVDGFSSGTLWANCRDKNCYQLNMSQLMSLKDYAKSPSDFGTQLCLWVSGDKNSYNLISPDYKINYKENNCSLVNENENNEAIKAIFITRLMGSFLTAYLVLVLLIVYKNHSINKKRTTENKILII